METAHDARSLRASLAGVTGPIVLVPTMGALHAGHLSLIEHARAHAGEDGLVVVSIFVNPIQFDRSDDLAAYPRPLEADLAACREAGVDLAFVPDVASMYAGDRSVTVSETALSRHLCGAARPGHFDGVCTVCLKLFLLTGCNAAVFGEKDFQQLAIIRRMVRDLDVPVEIIASPTLREADGLAMSSRNKRLSAAQREDAPRIFRALREAADMRDPAEILAHARREIETSPHARIDYLMLVDADSLVPVDVAAACSTILATAVFYGNVRLIDHVPIIGSE